MCRAEADRLYSRRSELDALGARLVCLVKEDFTDPKAEAGAPGEVDQFREAVWPGGEVWLDDKQAFYTALGGGAKLQTSLASFLAKIANPFSHLQKNLKSASAYKGNLLGEGFIHGGLYVVPRGAPAGAPPALAFVESEIGDHAPVGDVIDVVRQTSARS